MIGGKACGTVEVPGPHNCTMSYLDNFRHSNFTGNVYWNTSTRVSPSFPGGTGCKDGALNCATFAEWVRSGHDVGSLVADPQFKDYANDDFTVTSSAVLALGIKPLDLSRVGPGW